VSLLGKNATPAERMRGCVFVERFDSVDDAVKNGMTIGGGTPTFTPGAVTFDGASYLNYPIANSSIRSGNICSFEIETIPTAAVAGVAYLLVAGNPAGNYVAIRIVANVWQVVVSGVVALNSTFPLVVGQKVKFACTLSGNVGTLRTYLDGVAGATFAFAGTSQTITTPQILLGGFAAASYYTGQIHSVRLFSQELSPEEVLQYATNNVYSYRSRASIALQMRNVDHQALQTSDTSGNNRHGVFGVGVAAPTKLVGIHGYSLDGGDIFTSALTGAFNTDEISFAVEFAPNLAATDLVWTGFFFTDAGGAYSLYREAGAAQLVLNLGGTWIANIAAVTYGPYWRRGCRNTLVVSGKTGKNNIWLNEQRILVDNAVAWAKTDPVVLHLASMPGAAYTGNFTRFASWPQALTTVQIFDLLALWQKQASET